jgi:3-hydroxyisobutyrate dehydrogenase-like beta-hydroxyacid dehydrogenase
VIVGLLHPGEMGSALGNVLVGLGHEVIWASDGRSDATRERASWFRDVATAEALASDADVILSVCPPHAALEVAHTVGGFAGIYIDANAISPARADEVGALHGRFADGGIIGPPPQAAGETRLYLSGDEAVAVSALFADSIVATKVVANASALKMSYAAWSKGTAAMLLAIRDVACHYGVGDALEAEWRATQPELEDRLASAERSAARKGWRWIGEMEEIADTFAAAGEPDGFHRAAAEVFRS